LQVYEGRTTTIADIHRRWYKGYQQCAYGPEHSTVNFGLTFEDCTTEDLLESNKYTGPRVGRTINSEAKGPEIADKLPSFFGKEAKERVLNWETKHVMHVCNAKKSQKAVVGMGLSQDVHTYEDQYDFSQQGTREVDDEIASQENDDEIASQEIEDEIGSKLDHVMEAQRLEQDMRKIGGSSNGGTKLIECCCQKRRQNEKWLK
jgi:hypothetical protein